MPKKKKLEGRQEPTLHKNNLKKTKKKNSFSGIALGTGRRIRTWSLDILCLDDFYFILLISDLEDRKFRSSIHCHLKNKKKEELAAESRRTYQLETTGS